MASPFEGLNGFAVSVETRHGTSLQWLRRFEVLKKTTRGWLLACGTVSLLAFQPVSLQAYNLFFSVVPVATTVRAKHTVLEYLLVGKALEICQWLQQVFGRYGRGLFLGAHNVKDIKGFNVLNAPPKKTATLFMVLFRNILYLCSNIWSTFRYALRLEEVWKLFTSNRAESSKTVRDLLWAWTAFFFLRLRVFQSLSNRNERELEHAQIF